MKKLFYVLFMMFGFTMMGNPIISNAESTVVDATKTESYTYKINADKTSIVIPISFSKAGVYTYKIGVTNFSNLVHVTFLKNEELTSEKDIATIGSFKGTEHEFTKVVTEPYTYYVWVYSENPPAVEKSVTLSCAYHESDIAGREVKEGEEVRAVTTDKLDYTITLSKNSIVNLTADNSVQVKSDKTDITYAKNDEPAAAYLKKGTYHLIVGSGITNFKYTTQPLVLGKNVTKKKAKTLKVGKTATMKFAASDGKDMTYYYKIKLKKAKKVSVNIKAADIYSTVNVRMYKKKYNKVPYLEGSSNGNNGKAEFYGQVKKGSYAENAILSEKSVKLPAGTYYMEVSTRNGGECKVTVK